MIILTESSIHIEAEKGSGVLIRIDNIFWSKDIINKIIKNLKKASEEAFESEE